MTEYLSLAEIRQRLGLDEHDAYWLAQQRNLYAQARHAPLMLTDIGGERPFTVDDAIAYGEREAARVLP